MKIRLISSIILLLIAVPLILAGGKTFSFAIGIVGIFALKEIMDLKKNQGRVPLFMSLMYYAIFLILVYWSPMEYFDGVRVNYLWFVIFLLVSLLPCLFYDKKEYETRDAFYFFGVTLFLSLACHAILMIRLRSLCFFLYFVSISIFTDTFAYIFGSLIGKHLLVPRISPKKTIEGSVLGTLCATVLSSILYGFTGFPIRLPVVLITVFLSIVSQLGDLFFSKMKRENGQKDFSNLIPGHGGVLDRFDSMIFSSLACFLFLSFL